VSKNSSGGEEVCQALNSWGSIFKINEIIEDGLLNKHPQPITSSITVGLGTRKGFLVTGPPAGDYYIYSYGPGFAPGSATELCKPFIHVKSTVPSAPVIPLALPTKMCTSAWSCDDLSSYIKTTPLIRVLTWHLKSNASPPSPARPQRKQPPLDFTINDRYFNDPDNLIEIKFPSVEVWHLLNEDGFSHYFHIHQIAFQVYATNNIVHPFNGMVDVVEIPGKTNLTLILPFNTDPIIMGQFVVHCHILHHEDEGMMTQVDLGKVTNCGIQHDNLCVRSYMAPRQAKFCIDNPQYEGPPLQCLGSVATKVLQQDLKRSKHLI